MIDLGLQRISRLLARTPLPWRAIHIAGTNGKGSICAYVSGMLEAYNKSKWRSAHRHPGVRHGRFTSPHLIDRRDCIAINQETVQQSVFEQVEQIVLERNENERIEATEFEILTATAFEIFNRENVDVGVVEVGMGGRLDATNIIGQTEGLDLPTVYPDASTFRPSPLVTTISSIGLDHQAFLGNTLAEIAREKAGITKPGVPMVYDAFNDERVIEVLRSVAAEHNNTIIAASEDDLLSIVQHASKTPEARAYLDDYNRLPDYTKRNFQVAFAATLSALQQLVPASRYELSKDVDLMNDLFAAAICTSSVPGRQQFLSVERLTGRKQPILLDGAHNAQSAEILSITVEKLRRKGRDNGSAQKVTWVLAASNTKDIREMFAPLIAVDDSVYAVEFGPVDGMPWVKPLVASDILAAASDVTQPQCVPAWDYGTDILGALRAASKDAAGGPLVVAGSLYLVGDVLRLLRDG